jgi:hypothetical protein
MALIDLDRQPSPAELRRFGLVLLLVFGVLGAVVLWQFGSQRVAVGLWGTGLALTGLYYALPAVRDPFHFAWMRAVYPSAGWCRTGSWR